MELLPWVFTTGWASGVNAYLVVLILGLVERFAGVAAVPDVLARTDVLVAAGVLFAVDAVADKVPYLDSTWDAVHTAIRPTVGAVLGALLAGEASSVEQALAATAGGVTALASHAVKAGLRAAVNTSPEPASNVAVSVAEDVGVASVVSLVLVAPWLAAGVAAVLLVTGTVLVLLLLSRVRAWRRQRRQRTQPGTLR
ncbi:DUF4126 domain-containing protein [Quadrisphaera sp. GCM10027208]|uniref:DUF4126 domain-containing protein n=1 Tax=Quadrisphaera sp. GCM10027208 TaxID=3273423 RepID=UPI00360A2A28